MKNFEKVIYSLNPKTTKRILNNMYEIGILRELGGDTKAFLKKLAHTSTGFEKKVYMFLGSVEQELLDAMSDAIIKKGEEHA